MILGITGGIGTGKSRISEMFRALGAVVVSADELAREVVLPGSPVLERLAERFGPGVIAPDGTLDRKALGDIVFADPAARQDLNGIVHPAIAALSRSRLREISGRVPLVVYEAPLLFEAGAEGRVDAVLVVTASEEVQLRRLMARDNFGEPEARARIAAQMSQEEKVARADYVIDNSGSPEEAEKAVRALYQKLAGEIPPE